MMREATILPVILSGGAGTRLWPLSREAAPKPFMPLPDGETLLGKTASRALALPGVDTLFTITNRDYYFHTKDTYASNATMSAVYLLEPFGRNTAPAVAMGALCAQARGMGDRVLIVMPADHLIRDELSFAHAVDRARQLALRGKLVTFGIAPTHPETGFGYIECGATLEPAEGHAPAAYSARRFAEKPALAAARDYLTAGNYVWNSGMFAFTADAIVDALARHAPGVLASVRPVAQAIDDLANGSMLEIDAALFAAVPDISIDYAVMERAAEAGEV
ncbi:MAG TPA: sugar phosphate nucleotidyltransferase, partial [Casimicrobiaceae bacterium]|nr:sugar phosphate nucleotidyltransferase [Casimicrobiaceae bacterium]